MKRIFLLALLLSFAFTANSCSDDDRADCGCNGKLDQTITEEGVLSRYEDESGNVAYSITSSSNNSSKIFYVCNKDFVNSNINVNENNTFIIFSGKYTAACQSTGIQPHDATPT